MVAKVDVLASDDVAVADVEFPTARDLHQRYRIDAVPLVLIADARGVVQVLVPRTGHRDRPVERGGHRHASGGDGQGPSR